MWNVGPDGFECVFLFPGAILGRALVAYNREAGVPFVSDTKDDEIDGQGVASGSSLLDCICRATRVYLSNVR